MLDLSLPPTDGPLRVLCLGAHCDDIEIGVAATLLELAAARPVEIEWVFFAEGGERQQESEAAAALLFGRELPVQLRFFSHRDGFLPYRGEEVKDDMETLKLVRPDLVFTHTLDDRHQDHRLIADLTYNTFRDHLILEYEIPKTDGDLGRPTVYMPVSEENARRKAEVLLQAHRSQRQRPWFDEEVFLGLMRLRGMECGRHYAEAFTVRTLRLGSS